MPNPNGYSGYTEESIPLVVFDSMLEMDQLVANKVLQLVNEKNAAGLKTYIGLAAGSTQRGVFNQLVKLYEEKLLDFTNVVTYAVDEYYPSRSDQTGSFYHFMDTYLFSRINIPRSQVNFPDGQVPRDQVVAHCADYEAKIAATGIDLLLLGIGRTGAIGYNAPAPQPKSRTRLVALDSVTRQDAVRHFTGLAVTAVPYEAITIGAATIMRAKEIIMMAVGEHKADVVRAALEPQVDRAICPYLKEHSKVTFYLDAQAASKLTRFTAPWMVGRPLEWNLAEAKRAVVWLSQQVNKPILKLEDTDFEAYNLFHLLQKYDQKVDQLCEAVVSDLQRRIMTPDSLPREKRVLIMSPHPDDDVISAGGLFGALVDSGNEVWVAYNVNGSVGVSDAMTRQFLHFMQLSAPLFPESAASAEYHQRLAATIADIEAKRPHDHDSELVQEIKGNLRLAEARAGIEVMGLPRERGIQLNLPFYRTGGIKKGQVTESDYNIVVDLLKRLNPEHILIAGDLSDPHGTHRVCYNVAREALCRYNAEKGQTPEQGPLVWLYRGAWEEWPIHEATHFLPISRKGLQRKIKAILKHQSQKDGAMFLGDQEKEFWERARDRNLATAADLNNLGLPEFYAVEAYLATYAMPL